ncbi:MAG: (2Fe-2S) ferredoxin domain-containing protein [Chloroflexi bacterium]|nr:(2Fe-2S) ferredoxin domain-containing protein [Chloroflexota bacterium]
MPRSEKIERCLVCHNIDCAQRGSIPIGEEIARRLRDAGSPVEVRPYMCFGGCPQGPNIVLFPQGTWYAQVQPEDAEAIANHILGGPRADRLAASVDPELRDLILEILDAGILD